MASDLNSVKTAGAAYHHGNLRSKLVSEAEALIAERGLDQFSLRETARRAGVSPAAPAHHFGDASGLLTAVAVQGFLGLAEALDAVGPSASRRERIRALGLAYVRYALEKRGPFEVMWRKAILRTDDPALVAASHAAFSRLDSAVRPGGTPAGVPDGVLAPSIACWSIVHGFARLALDGAFGSDEVASLNAATELLPKVLEHIHV